MKNNIIYNKLKINSGILYYNVREWKLIIQIQQIQYVYIHIFLF